MNQITYYIETQPGNQRNQPLEQVLKAIAKDINTLYQKTDTIVQIIADYSATADDRWIIANAAPQNIIVYLPLTANITHALSVEKIDATANTVTIRSSSNELLGGVASVTLSSQYDKATLVPSNGAWYQF